MPVGFGTGFALGLFSGDPGWPGVGDGLETFRFGGVPFGAPGDSAGPFSFGGCFDPGEPGRPGLPACSVGEPTGVPEGFTVGEEPTVVEGFAPSRFGGTGFCRGAGALGEATGETLALGEPAPGFTKLGAVFCPAAGVGEPVAPGDPATCPLLPVTGFTKGVGLGKSLGGGFCSAMVFWSSATS